MHYILGGGIAGLISAFYNKEYIVISDQIGGQMAENNLGPRLLEVNDNSTRFLNDLGIDKAPTKVAKIGYYDKMFIDSVSSELREKYYIKSRSVSPGTEVPPSVMSDGKKVIVYWDIDWKVLIRKLHESLGDRFINAKVLDIKTGFQELTIQKEAAVEKITLPYHKLISTLPAPLFYKLAKSKPDIPFTYIKKLFVTVDYCFDLPVEYDYIYFPGDNDLYHRMTILEDKTVVVEYTSNLPDQALMFEWSLLYKSHKSIPTGQIQYGKVSKIHNVHFVGRYACWDHDIKTDDVVRQAIDINVGLSLSDHLKEEK